MDINRLLEFLAEHWILSLLLVAILVALSIEPLLRRLRGIKRISVVESTRLINHENACVIDIREDKEFAKEHVLDSLSAPLTHLPSRIKALDNLKGCPLILVWTTGQQAMRAAGQFRKQGHKRVYVLQGGIESWREAKMPLFSGHAKAKPKSKADLQPEVGKSPEVGAQPETSTQPAEVSAQPELSTQPAEVSAQPEADTPHDVGTQPEIKQPKANTQSKAKQSKSSSRAKGGKKPKARKKARPAKKPKAKQN